MKKYRLPFHRYGERNSHTESPEGTHRSIFCEETARNAEDSATVEVRMATKHTPSCGIREASVTSSWVTITNDYNKFRQQWLIHVSSNLNINFVDITAYKSKIGDGVETSFNDFFM